MGETFRWDVVTGSCSGYFRLFICPSIYYALKLYRSRLVVYINDACSMSIVDAVSVLDIVVRTILVFVMCS